MNGASSCTPDSVGSVIATARRSVMAVLSEAGDRALAGCRQLIGTCSIKPHVPLNTVAATRSPSHRSLYYYSMSALTEVISTAVVQGSKGSASPRHVFDFEGSRAAAAG